MSNPWGALWNGIKDSTKEYMKQETIDSISAIYLSYQSDIEKAANINTLSKEEASEIVDRLKKVADSKKVLNEPLRTLLDGINDESIKEVPEQYQKQIKTIKRAWDNVKAFNPKTHKQVKEDRKSQPAAETTGTGEGSGAGGSRGGSTGGSGGGTGGSGSGGSDGSTGNSDKKGHDFLNKSLESVGSFFSGALSVFSGVGSAVSGLMKNGYDPEKTDKQIERFQNIAKKIDEDPDLSQEQRDEAYKNLIGTAMQEMGIDEESAAGVSSFLFDTLKMPVKTVAYGLSESGNFLKEIFTPQLRYNVYDPLSDQAVDRYLKSYRDSASADIDAKQDRFGVQNLMKLGFNEEEATKFAQFAKSPMAKQLLQTGGSQIFTQLYDPERGGALWAKIKDNIDGVLYGFQGDGGQIFSQLSGDTFSETKLQGLGAAASILTSTPSYETGYARAKDYAATIRGMQASGWDASAYIARQDTDVVRNMETLRRSGRLDVAKERYVAKKREEAMEVALKGLSQEQIDAVKKENEGSKITGKPVYKEDGSLDLEASLGAATEVQRDVEKAGEAAAKAAKTSFDAVAEGDTSVADLKDISAEVTGQIIADSTQERTKSEMQVAQLFNRVRGAKEAFGGKTIGIQEAQQLIRMLGDSDVNGDYGAATDRAMVIGSVALKRDIDMKTMTSAVSLAGETAKKMGMDPAVAQQAAELGVTMFDNRMSNLGPGQKVDANRALALSMQNAVRVLNGRNYGNLVWLQRLGTNGRFTNNDTGKAFQAMAEKIQKGETLTKEEWELLNDDSKRAEAFDGSVEEYNASRSLIPRWAETMDNDQKWQVQTAAVQREQERVLEEMESSTSEDWKRNVSTDVGTKVVSEVYGTSDKMRELYTTLLQRFSPEDAIKLMSGQRAMTSEDEEKLKEVAGDKYDSLKGMLDIARDRSSESQKQLGAALTSAATEEAKAHAFGGLEDLGAALAYQDPHNAGFIKNMIELGKVGLMDQGAPIIQRVLQRSDTAGGRVGAFISEMFGATAEPGMLSKQFEEEMVGLRGVLTAGAADNVNAEEYFQQVWGTKKEGWGGQKGLRSKLMEVDEGITAEMTQEEAFKRIRDVFSDTNQIKLQKEYAKALGDTDFGKALNEMFKSRTKEERDNAWAKAKEAAKRNGMTLPDAPPAPESPTTETVTPVSEQSAPTSAPQAGEAPPTVPAPAPTEGGGGAPTATPAATPAPTESVPSEGDGSATPVAVAVAPNPAAPAAPSSFVNDETHPMYVKFSQDGSDDLAKVIRNNTGVQT